MGFRGATRGIQGDAIMTTQEPIDDFFLEYGTTAIYTNPAGVESAIDVIYERTYNESSLGSGGEVENYEPLILVRAEDASDAIVGSFFVIDGKKYAATKVAADGTGWIVINLSKDY